MFISPGAASIEVPALVERDFKVSFYAYKEGITRSRIRFINDTTKEFIFFNVVWKATKAGVISTIVLDTGIRQKVTSLVTVRNPLEGAVEITRFEVHYCTL